MADDTPVEPPDVDDITTIALRHPGVPATLIDLAARKGEALEIIEARVQVLKTLRKAALGATMPPDWVLYKAPDELGGQIVGYLQDCGCERIRDLFGIEVFNVGRPERVPGAEPGSFLYLISGSGRCKLTGQSVPEVEGGRSSTDDFCKDKHGAALELAVRKAARANLDGNITRELAAMKSVPIEEIKAAWEGTKKSTDQCRTGRGFGSRAQRAGGPPKITPPICDICQSEARWFPAGTTKDGRAYGAFWACPNKEKKHPTTKWSISADEWALQNREPGEEG